MSNFWAVDEQNTTTIANLKTKLLLQYTKLTIQRSAGVFSQEKAIVCRHPGNEASSVRAIFEYSAVRVYLKYLSKEQY